MLLTCSSYRGSRKTGIWGGGLWVLRLKPKASCITFHEGCSHLLKVTKQKPKRVESIWEALLVLGVESERFWDPWGRVLLFYRAVPNSLIFFLPTPELRALGLFAEDNAAGRLPWSPLSGSWSAPLGCRTWQGCDGSSGHIWEACLPDFQALSVQLMTSGCQTLKIFQQMEQKPFWFTLITWTMHLVDHPRSQGMPPGSRSPFSVFVDRNPIVCLIQIFRFIFHFLTTLYGALWWGIF